MEVYNDYKFGGLSCRGHPDLNWGPLDLQSNALPLSYTPSCWKHWSVLTSQYKIITVFKGPLCWFVCVFAGLRKIYRVNFSINIVEGWEMGQGMTPCRWVWKEDKHKKEAKKKAPLVALGQLTFIVGLPTADIKYLCNKWSATVQSL